MTPKIGMAGFGIGRITVVGEEQKKRVLVETEFDEFIAHLGDAFIHFKHHLLHGFLARGLPLLSFARAAKNRVGGTLNGIVRGFMGDVEAERLVAIVLDELEGIAIDEMSGIALLNRFLAAVPPVVLLVIAPVAEVVDVAAVVAFKVIEPMVVGVKLRIFFRIAEVPLADDACGVAGLLEEFGEGNLGLFQALAVLGMIVVRMNHSLDAGPLLVTSGEQAGAGG